MNRVVVLGFLLCVVSLYTQGLSSAAAQAVAAEETQARAHFQAGTAYFDRGEYADAIREFERAFAMSPRPQLQYNLYLAHERLGHIDEAIDHLYRYLAQAPDVPNRDALEARLDNLMKRRRESDAPTRSSAASGDEDANAATLSSEARNESGSRPRGAIVAWSIGGAGLAAFGVFAGLSMAEDDRLRDRCGEDCSDSEVKTLGTYTLIADIGIGVATVSAITGLALFLRHRKREEVRALGHLAPFFSSERVGLWGEIDF